MTVIKDHIPSQKHYSAIKYILEACCAIVPTDHVLILCDENTEDIATIFYKESCNFSKQVNLLKIPKMQSHGKEPNDMVVESMCSSTLIISICTYSLAHSQARMKSSNVGARFLSLPLYSWELLEDNCIFADYKSQSSLVRYFSDAFTAGNCIHVTSSIGTDLTLDIGNRYGNYCPGFVANAGDLGSPPDIESNVSPIENKSNGRIVVDGSITCPEIGLLTTPVTLDVINGKVIKVSSDRSDYVNIIEKMLCELGSSKRVVAECGVGLNPLAKLTGSMLTDEGAIGCVHFGLGANNTVGGKNKVDFRLDFVLREPNLIIDNTLMIKEGDICYKNHM